MLTLIRPDFLTHSNYLEFLRNLSNDLSCSSTITPPQNIPTSNLLIKKNKLISLTFDNLVAEMNSIDHFHDYSSICVSWIPVKAYYLIFNELLLLEYLLNGSTEWLTKGHSGLLDKFKEQIGNGQIEFSAHEFNKRFIPSAIEAWSIPVGANVARGTTSEIRQQEIIRILYRYSREEFRRVRNIKAIRGRNKQKFLSSTKISLFDFFYLYRIKANYRDMQFIDMDVPEHSFYNFYRDYFFMTMNFYIALKKLVNELSVSSLGRELIY